MLTIQLGNCPSVTFTLLYLRYHSSSLPHSPPVSHSFKDDVEIKDDERVTLHRDYASGHYELLISHVQRSDEGVYKCIARNKFGRAECQAAMTVSGESSPPP